MSTNRKSVPYRLALAVALLQAALTAGVSAQQEECIGGDRVRSVDVWGSPATTFSPTPARTLEELKSQFAAYEADYAEVLRQAGWEGNPEDLFATVRNAQEGGAVTFRSAPKGTEFEWMAYRRRGKPACVKDVIWIGRDPFPAWQIIVESKGVEYTFVLPQDCLNLGFEKGQRRDVPPPTCNVDASFDADRDIIAITGSSNVPDFRIVAVQGPGASLEQLESAGGGRWTLQPGADGTFTFTARATADYGKQSECSARVAVVRKKPELRLTASADPDTNLITVDANGSIGDVSLTGITLPDGGAGDLAALQSTGDPLVWTYDPSDSLQRKPGDYPFSFAGVARLHGYEDSGKATVSINVGKRAGRWIVRAFGAYLDAFDEYRATTIRTPTQSYAGIEESSVLKLDSGTGFGLGLEYLFNDRLGVEAGIIVADLDAHFMVDILDLWGMADDEAQFSPLTLGVNYHVTPHSRVDFFVGPFVALVQYDDVQFNTLGEVFTRDFEDDWTFGLNLGVDVPFGSESPWAFTGGVKYLETSAEGANDVPNLDVDPLIFTGGIAYRFR